MYGPTRPSQAQPLNQSQREKQDGQCDFVNISTLFQ